MKFSPLKPFVVAILALSPFIQAAELEDIDTSSIPNTFSNGSPADADEVNANFEYLRNNLDLLVELLEERKAISTDADRFTGTYFVSGMEFTLDSCQGAPQVNHSAIVGTATVTNGVVSFSNTQTRYVLRDGHLDEASSHVDTEDLGADSFELTLDSAGNFSGVSGAMAADGNSFSIISNDTEGSDCSSSHVLMLNGQRKV